MSAVWPWFLVAGLGAFHGLNPAMGWLFAVALGLHRQSRAIVALALIPIALGHAAAIAATIAVLLLAGIVVDQQILRHGSGALLLAWALYHMLYGNRHRIRFGMQVGLAGLAMWSFVMAMAHGAGLMLLPAVISLCLSGGPAAELTASGSLPIGLAVVGLHSLAMLAVTGTIAAIVYGWTGVAFLRQGWFNLDRLWTAALVATGLVLVVV